MTTVVTLVRSHRLNVDLRVALRESLGPAGGVTLLPVPDWDSVEESLVDRTVAAVVFDLAHPEIGRTERIRSAIRSHPAVEFVLYVGGLHCVQPQDIVDVARAGVRYSLPRDVGDRQIQLTPLLDEVISAGVNERLLGKLEPHLDGEQMDLVRLVMRHAPEALRVRDLACRLNMSTRTLARHASGADMPPPSQMLSWIHLYHVSIRIVSDDAPVSSAVEGSAFSSASVFRRALLRSTGLRTSDLRRMGWSDELARTFASSLIGAAV